MGWQMASVGDAVSLTWILDWLAQQDAMGVAAVTALFLALETTLFIGLVVPGDAAALLAGTTVTAPAELAPLLAAAIAGSVLGESGGYLIGQRYGHRLRYSRAGRWLGEPRWQRAENLLHGRDGGLTLVAARFVPVVHALIPVLAGTVRMPYRRFMPWELFGSTVWASCYLGVGALAGQALRSYGHAASVAILLLIAVVALTSRRLRRDGRTGDRTRRTRNRTRTPGNSTWFGRSSPR